MLHELRGSPHSNGRTRESCIGSWYWHVVCKGGKSTYSRPCVWQAASSITHDDPHLLVFMPRANPSSCLLAGHNYSLPLSKTQQTWWDFSSTFRLQEYCAFHLTPCLPWSLWEKLADTLGAVLWKGLMTRNWWLQPTSSKDLTHGRKPGHASLASSAFREDHSSGWPFDADSSEDLSSQLSCGWIYDS